MVEELDIDTDSEGTEDVFLDGKYQIDVKHLRIGDFLEDLGKDRTVLQLIYDDARTILENDRDQTSELEAIIENKIKETPYNTGNKKILIFSAFADTVDYIYKTLNRKLLKMGVYTAKRQWIGYPG